MRSRIIALAAALALLSASSLPAAAKKAEPEMILHIEASAQVEPDRYTLPLALTGSGPTKAEAEADLAKREAEMMDQLKAMGVNPAQVRTIDTDQQTEATAMASSAAACAAADAAMAAAAPARPKSGKARRSVSAAAPACDGMTEEFVVKSFMIELDRPEQFEVMLAEFGGERSSISRRRIQYGQSNPEGARKKARDMALAKARADADAYAETLGYRVVRISRVSNARPAINLQDMFGFVAMIDRPGNAMQPGWFAGVVVESVAIDFVLEPK